MLYRRLLIVALTIVLPSAVGWPDTLVLSNGDTLSGSLLRITDGLFFFQNVVAGKLIVLAEEVKFVTTDDPWILKLKDGDTLKGCFVHVDNAVKVRSSDGAMSTSIDLVSIDSATPIQKAKPSAEKDTSDIEPPGLQTELAIGQYWRTGTSDYSEPFAKLQVLSEEEQYRFFSDSLLELTTDDDFSRLFSILAEWQFFPERPNRPQLRLSLERDTANALDLRATVGAGIERSLYQDANQELDVSADLTADFEYYDAPSSLSDAQLFSFIRDWFLGRMLIEGVVDQDKTLRRNFKQFTMLSYYADQEEQRQDLGLRFGVNYSRDLFRGSRFDQELAFMPGLTDWGDLRAESLSAFQVPITQSLKLKLELQVSYEEAPANLGVDDWRTALGASFAWDF